MKKKTASRLYKIVALAVFCCIAETGALISTRQVVNEQKAALAAQQLAIDSVYSEVERVSKQLKEMRDYAWKLENKLKKAKRR